MGLKLIRRPRGDDWDGCIQIVNIQMKFLRNHYLDFKLEFDGKDHVTREIAEKDPSVRSFNSTEIVIRDEGHEPCAFNLWLDRHVSAGSDGFGVESQKTLVPKNSYLVTPDNQELKLGRVVVTYMSTQFDQDLQIDAMNLVEAVLQDFSSGEVEHMHHKNA
ncbi:hypothetical protein [Marinobacter persicus]|uniref:hypothetical protein n=1 Tax=Marinobacter persicus TaxID=930118 RepID=UPI000B817FEC|nr:hypothetical protein [Marinobacter persicus]GHD45296.1 hypothetical protein GCM10008110_11210 [Marinobacter persicus]